MAKKKSLSWESLEKMDRPEPPRGQGGGRPQPRREAVAAEPPAIPPAEGEIPIRRGAAAVVAGGFGQCHVGLAFDRLASTWRRKTPRDERPEDEWNVEPWEQRRGADRVSRHPKKEFYNAICELARATKANGAPMLDELRRRRVVLADDLRAAGWSVRAETLTSLWCAVSGLGLPHPFETGLLLDRTCGVPYFPGSSIKGAARARAAAQAVPDADTRAVFGGDDRSANQGGVVFFDAYPATWPELWLDVLTPHYKEYYQAGQPPGDWLTPEPAYFLSVAPGQAFEFLIAARPGARAEALADLAIDSVRGAAEQQGLGGKTGVGYGAFG